jgi:ribosomal protein S18 acetylase RimI-like enzyme
MTISLRPITSADEGFLYRVYASTREDELAQTGWAAAQKEAFLTMQFNAQHKYYTEQYRKASFDIILLDGEPVGRLYLDRRKSEIRIVDIALLPAYRNRGIGSALLHEILAEGARTGRRVSIHVERFNPALRLYTRLGFQHIGDNGVYYLMEWVHDAGQIDRR